MNIGDGVFIRTTYDFCPHTVEKEYYIHAIVGEAVCLGEDKPGIYSEENLIWKKKIFVESMIARGKA